MRTRQKSFTLIEMLLVVTIIGILASIVILIQAKKAQEKQEAAAAKKATEPTLGEKVPATPERFEVVFKQTTTNGRIGLTTMIEVTQDNDSGKCYGTKTVTAPMPNGGTRVEGVGIASFGEILCGNVEKPVR